MNVLFCQIESFVLSDKKGSIKSSIVICKPCLGEGTISIRKYQNHTDGYYWETFTCEHCRGKGRVKQFDASWNELI